MADIYRVIYVSTGSDIHKSVVVSATTEANAVAAVKAADSTHKQHITATVTQHNVIVGS